ncbi:helix-turn-helix domain-containing protein [Erwinia tracheiphila]|uniref:XRE family transcriptional regulator n=1 Tax=Erwinia tracheiphila TaxID=65700 RepID=A0A345CXG1_9GAMM|nr:helix-turn-helix transcriptional regulator [Erwinia tracheiphila]AXF78128.1 XRE family transcriptional regulator [Erwinia tracheiphila]EOS94574.1 helix-turn-helix domain-containing protein [Erwinia tracheiphila PSU-1]UIA83158.1 helix-turn-helix domain-containing protein [Erwinia tracheiphila]UIA88188.1 helix-turn-helix domain-containing protein [Erwinia tracheiphila]UIA91737.1 helix-turn-helix domain-containing protein [Erwinia tracheiphila]
MPSFFTNDYQKLISYLVDARKKRNITQMQLANAMRIEQTLISRIERCERRLDAVEFYHICTLLGVTTEDIYNHFLPRFQAINKVNKPSDEQ